MTERIRIDALMQRTGVQFGTSGARGLAHSMTNGLCHAYTSGFLSFLEDQTNPSPQTPEEDVKQSYDQNFEDFTTSENTFFNYS
mgnify:CR=1 FL=1